MIVFATRRAARFTLLMDYEACASEICGAPGPFPYAGEIEHEAPDSINHRHPEPLPGFEHHAVYFHMHHHHH